MAGIIQLTDPSANHPPPNASIRALCIHGHFYQPPREDPLTGLIPDEIGAKPYKNWNERIHAECYQPNAELGNFERISFNIGPTLFKWIAAYDPITYHRILAQDRSNVELFGVGNAMAQPFHHTILPLARRSDKEIQIAWGIADFEHHFGRRPTGMWLPETAVDIETLEVMADQGIEFTILAPWQAETKNLDPTQPYWVKLPGGQRIAVFFYHADLSGGISFDPEMTLNAHNFIQNDVVGHYNRNGRSEESQILLVASDGELYGHHQAYRDWFLAYLVNGAGATAKIHLTFPSLWLREHPPTQEIHLQTNTSWSCHHGVLRWAGDCGCLVGRGHWKKYLREALDNLADKIDWVFSTAIHSLGFDPWKLRIAYIKVHLGEVALQDIIQETDHSPQLVKPWPISEDDLSKINLLLQAEFNRQRMFTSCGFFYEDFDRIEPKNNIAYAVHAIRLIQKACGIDLSYPFRSELNQVASDRTQLRGDQVFDKVWRYIAVDKG